MLAERSRREVRRDGKPPVILSGSSGVRCRVASAADPPTLDHLQSTELFRIFEELLTNVWGYSPSMATRTVDNQILKLRKKVEDVPLRAAYRAERSLG